MTFVVGATEWVTAPPSDQETKVQPFWGESALRLNLQPAQLTSVVGVVNGPSPCARIRRPVGLLAQVDVDPLWRDVALRGAGETARVGGLQDDLDVAVAEVAAKSSGAGKLNEMLFPLWSSNGCTWSSLWCSSTVH